MSTLSLLDKRYTCIIDDVEYKSKPLGESHTITSRLTYKGNEQFTLDEIADAISKGRTLLPFNFQTYKSGKILGKKNEYFKETNLVLLDIDGGMTLDAMYAMHEKIGIKPNLVYKSFSHTEAYHKFRVIYCLPYMIYDPEEYRLVWETFNKFYLEGTVLDRTHDVSRMYFGTNAKADIISYEPVDIAKLADSVGTLISSSEDSVKLTQPKMIDPSVYDSLKNIDDESFYKSEMIRQFENLELSGRGDYHKLRSLMFVYHYLGRIERFLDLAPLNKSEYPRSKWEHDLKYDLDSGRSGHTFTYQILDELGAFDTAMMNKNKDTIVSNYLLNRLRDVQCYKELDISVDRYLPLDKIKEIIKSSSESGSRVLIIAPTGTGKTYSVITALKELGLKGILSVPNRMNAQQNMITYGIGGAFQDHPIHTAVSEHKIVSAVWEMLGSNDLDYSNHILINDEAHAHVHDHSYRGKSIRSVHRVIPRFKSAIDITATPTGLDLKKYTHIYQFVRDDHIEYTTSVYVGFNETSRLSILNKSEGKAILLENKKKNLMYYKAKLQNDHGDKSVSIVTADDKDINEVYQSIAQQERIPEDVKFVLCTSVLTAGVNIQNEDVTDIFIVGIKNITTIKQFVARSRNVKKLNIHIFLKEGSRDYYTFNIFDERNYEASLLEKRAMEIEKDIERDLLDTESSLRRAKLQRHSIEIEEDYNSLDEEVWRKYFQHLSISNFVTALEEFFEDIKVYFKDYEVDQEAKEFKDSLEDDIDEVEIYDVTKVLGEYSSTGSKAVELCLGYYESIRRGTASNVYKRLKFLFPDVKSKDYAQVNCTEQDESYVKDYAYFRSEGYSHLLSLKIIDGTYDPNVIAQQVTALMFLSDRDKYKRNSPAYVLMDTVADKLPKNQLVTADTMKELCERIDQRQYRENDRYSNTIKEIGKLVSIKKDRKTGGYNVGDWLFVDELDTKTIHDCTRLRIESSIDSEVRRSIKERRKWLELNEEFKEKRRRQLNNET